MARLRAEGAQAQAEQDSLIKQLLKHQVLLVFKTYVGEMFHSDGVKRGQMVGMGVETYCFRNVKRIVASCCARYGSISDGHADLKPPATVMTGELNNCAWDQQNMCKGLITDQGVPAMPFVG